MRKLLVATLAISALPALAGSLDDFVNKPDDEIAALKITKAKMNSLLARSSKSITLDTVIVKEFHSNYDPSEDRPPHALDADAILPTSTVKCTLQQVAELKAITADDTAGHKLSYHLQVSRIEAFGYSSPDVRIGDDASVSLAFGQWIENNQMGRCHVIKADAIRAAIRSRFPDIERSAAEQRRSRAQELAPANENELIDDLQRTTFHPPPHQPGPKVDTIDL